SGQRDRRRGDRQGFSPARHTRRMVAIRFRARRAGAVGIAREVQVDRTLQVLPRARLETLARRQEASAAPRALSMQSRRVSLAARDDDHAIVRVRTPVVLTMLRKILLINPTMTSRRSARFPLAVLSLSAALAGRYDTYIIDGN